MVVNRPKSMKPLYKKDLTNFVKRFGNFVDADFRSIEVVSPLQMRVVLGVQDSARAFDWISITLEFSGVSDARLLEQNRLSLLDMSQGANLIHDNDLFAFGLGECYNISTTKSSTCYIISTDLKYEEGLF